MFRVLIEMRILVTGICIGSFHFPGLRREGKIFKRSRKKKKTHKKIIEMDWLNAKADPSVDSGEPPSAGV